MEVAGPERPTPEQVLKADSGERGLAHVLGFTQLASPVALHEPVKLLPPPPLAPPITAAFHARLSGVPAWSPFLVGLGWEAVVKKPW